MMRTLPNPALVRSGRHRDTVRLQRAVVEGILSGADDRLLVIAGPCSAHDSRSMLDYVSGLTEIAARHDDDLYVVARVYVEKPRTRLGWPGLLLDPFLDGGNRVDEGIATARALLEAVADRGMPIAGEFVEPLLADYLADLICWGAIGARTVESPPHRRLASALPMPIGFKNRGDGAVAPAVDAIAAAAVPQPVFSIGDDGAPQWGISAGNRTTHLVLRGGESGPNHHESDVEKALDLLRPGHTHPTLVVDCSHGNSGKDHRNQPLVARDLADQISAGQTGIAGVMVESFIHEGCQPHSPAPRPGVSITDACLSLEQTEPVLTELAAAVRHRRRVVETSLVEAT